MKEHIQKTGTPPDFQGAFRFFSDVLFQLTHLNFQIVDEPDEMVDFFQIGRFRFDCIERFQKLIEPGFQLFHL